MSFSRISKTISTLSLAIAIFSLSFSSFSSINTFAKLETPGSFVTTETLNLREDPCGKIIGSVSKGTNGEAYSYKNNATCKMTINGVTKDYFFFQVKIDNGGYGFLDSQYLTALGTTQETKKAPKKPAAATPTKKATVTSTVRTGGADLNKVSNSNRNGIVIALAVSGLIASLIGGEFAFKKFTKKSEKK